ncbi:hypothetical protein M427DRAFT_130825 [Gonapodya prolifera JEL478]|uniref:Rad21/Rec8-like protein N-terminal domain-containing protein n=1 Tax=Gonapodya prolifera (strain JEL478) TaxID=1344416 RepID=A0A139AXM3_GONPJ|nr:hypothetical protein M427DRAFT_130825 [Gonapodya prolifera JEL478]|eukprot:KXS21323.1 hypothetical protein M427DRAFT_130825 [Gonapodya prolifera JEL478]
MAFFSEGIMSRRGPLARVWLAAHWEKKLTKPQVMQTSIETAADAITDSNEPLTLRHSGQLLLGVVKIFSKKAIYLLNDCAEAIAKLKSAFKPGAVDLPDDHAVSALNQITLQVGPGLGLTAADLRLGEPGFVPANAWASRHSQSQDVPSIGTPISQQAAAPSSSQRKGGTISMIDQLQPAHDLGFDDGFDPLALGGDDDLFLEGERKRPSKKKRLEEDMAIGTPEEPEVGRNASMRRDEPVSPIARLGGKFDDSMELDNGEGPGNFSFLDDPKDQALEWNGAGLDMDVDLRPDEEFMRAEGADTSGLLFDLPAVSVPRKKAPAQQGQRKRKLVVDEVTELKSALLHAQLKDTSDILQKEHYAPTSDRWLHLPERPTAQYYLTHPAEDRMPPDLLPLFARDLKEKAAQKRKEKEKEQHKKDPKTPREATPGVGLDDLEGNKENIQPGADLTFDMDFGAPDMLPLDEEVRVDPPSVKSPGQESRATFESPYDFDETDSRVPETDGKGISRNAQKVMRMFKARMENVDSPPVSFKAMTSKSPRADIATVFHEILVLKTYDIVDCAQKDAFGDIEVRARPKLFTTVV